VVVLSACGPIINCNSPGDGVEFKAISSYLKQLQDAMSRLPPKSSQIIFSNIGADLPKEEFVDSNPDFPESDLDDEPLPDAMEVEEEENLQASPRKS
jgi:hypothetical protein